MPESVAHGGIGVQLPLLLDTSLADQALDDFAKRAKKVPPVPLPLPPKPEREQGVSWLGKMSKGMQDFSREQMRETNSARYFVREWATFLPVGSKAHDAVMSLTSALAGGLGLGLALEAAQLGLKWFVEYLNKTSEAQKAAKKAADDHAQALRDLKRDTDDYLFSLQGAPASLAFLRDGLRKLDDESAPLKKRLAELTTQIETLQNDAPLWEDGAFVPPELTAEVEQLTLQLKRLDEKRKALGESFQARVGGEEDQAKREAEKVARERSREQAKQEAEKDRAQREADVRAAFQIAKAANDARLAAEAKALDDLWELEDKKAAEREALEKDRALRALALGDEERYAELAALQAWFEEEIRLYGDQAEKKAEIERLYAERKKAIVSGQLQFERQALGMLTSAYSTLARNVAAGFGTMMRGSRAYERAMAAAGETTQRSADLSSAAIAAFVQDVIAAHAVEAATNALIETAKGFGALAMAAWGNPKAAEAAGLHFVSAAKWAAVAGVAGAAAATIGAHRGMTSAERSDVDAANQADAARSEGSSSGGGSGGFRGSRDDDGTRTISLNDLEVPVSGDRDVIVVREVIYVGDPFETPAETARRARRRLDLADQLDMGARRRTRAQEN